MSGRRLRVAVDARYLSHGLVGGVHTYIEQLLPALLREGPEHDYVLWVDDKAPFDLPELTEQVEIRSLPWHSGSSSIRNDLRLGRAMLNDGADIAHFPANYGLSPAALPTVVTLHDAINVMPLHEILSGHPKDLRTISMMSYLSFVTRMSMRRRPVIATVSEYSRREIRKYINAPEESIGIVHPIVDERFRVLKPGAAERFRQELRLRSRVLVADAIKNPDCTLRAFRELPTEIRDETSLVFFARRTPVDSVRRSASAGESTVLTGLRRDDLVLLFNAADLFVFPTWYEGFGLPAAEAMSCGTPVIGSSRGSVPEVVGDGGVITDAEDYRAIASAIVALLRSDGELAGMRERAMRQAAKFTAEVAAGTMLDVYERAYVTGSAARDGRTQQAMIAPHERSR